ncbi:MAG: 2'-5' RNA ligase family protein [Aquaticitalea sp.]
MRLYVRIKMNHSRKQLTLFVSGTSATTIDKIRARFNPLQHYLIAAHVTLCREDEIEPIQEIIKRMEMIDLKEPIRITFKSLERFANGKGVLIPCANESKGFQNLRKIVLGSKLLTKNQIPHLTLMHPRNSTCTDDNFKKLMNEKLPTVLFFDTISLIEQNNGGKWNIIREFPIVKMAIE